MRVAQLVRDLKTEPRSGTTDVITKIDDIALRKALLVAKLHSEVEEIASDMDDPEEYADVLETLYALAQINNISVADIDDAADAKNVRWGSLNDGIFWSPTP